MPILTQGPGGTLWGVQHLNWQVAALDTCQAPLDVVSDVCFHAGPVDTGSGQVHCLVDAGMASMEVYHDAICMMVEQPLFHPW